MGVASAIIMGTILPRFVLTLMNDSNVNLGKIKHLFHTNVLNVCMKQLFGKNAQVENP